MKGFIKTGLSAMCAGILLLSSCSNAADNNGEQTVTHTEPSAEIVAEPQKDEIITGFDSYYFNKVFYASEVIDENFKGLDTEPHKVNYGNIPVNFKLDLHSNIVTQACLCPYNDGIVYYLKDDNSIHHFDGEKDSALFEGLASWLQIYDDKLYYVLDLKVYCYDFESKQSEMIYDKSEADEMYLTDEGIFIVTYTFSNYVHIPSVILYKWDGETVETDAPPTHKYGDYTLKVNVDEENRYQGLAFFSEDGSECIPFVNPSFGNAWYIIIDDYCYLLEYSYMKQIIRVDLRTGKALTVVPDNYEEPQGSPFEYNFVYPDGRISDYIIFNDEIYITYATLLFRYDEEKDKLIPYKNLYSNDEKTEKENEERQAKWLLENPDKEPWEWREGTQVKLSPFLFSDGNHLYQYAYKYPIAKENNYFHILYRVEFLENDEKRDFKFTMIE